MPLQELLEETTQPAPWVSVLLVRHRSGLEPNFYSAEYADQSDYGDNPNNYNVHYTLLEGGVGFNVANLPTICCRARIARQ